MIVETSGASNATFFFGFKVIWNESDRNFVLQVILAGAFYPNYFVKRTLNVEDQEGNVIRNLNGLDPLRTVFMRGWPVKQPGYLYAKRLQEIFSWHLGVPQERIIISFDGSMRVYVQYREKETTESDESLYRISDFVYTSIKMRHCNVPVRIELLNAKEAQERKVNQKLDRFEKSVFFHRATTRKTTSDLSDIRPELPDLDVNFIPLSIENVSPLSSSFSSLLTELYKIIHWKTQRIRSLLFTIDILADR